MKIPNCNDGICQGCGHLAFRRHMTEEHDIHPHTLAFHMLLKDIGDLHDRKSKDYGRSDSPLANVISSEEWGIEGWVGSMVRLNDKVKRLQQYAQRGTLANESAEDSMLDIAVYALIALVLYREKSEEAPAPDYYLSPEWYADPTSAPTFEGEDGDCTYCDGQSNCTACGGRAPAEWRKDWLSLDDNAWKEKYGPLENTESDVL